MAKRHPHTNAVSIASDTMTKVIGTFGHEPRFMQQHSDRTAARHATIANVASDVEAWKGRLPQHMIEKLAKLDR